MKISYLFVFMVIFSSCNHDSRIKELENRTDSLEYQLEYYSEILEDLKQEKEKKIAEFKKADELIRETFINEGYKNLEFNYSNFMSISSRLNGSPDDDERKLINLGYIRKGRYLGTSVVQLPLYDLELTSKGRDFLLENEANYYDDGSKYYRWKFKVGRAKYKEILKYEYLSEQELKITFTCEVIEITDIGRYVFDEDDEIGAILEYEEVFVLKGDKWKLKDYPFGYRWYK